MRKHKIRLFSTILAFAMMFGLGSQASPKVVKGNAEVEPKAAANVTTTVTYNNLGSPYGDSKVENLVDGNDDTFCWFSAVPSIKDNVSYIQLTFSEEITIYNVRVLFHTSDRMIGELSYSTDGENFISLDSKVDTNDQIIRFQNPVSQVRHLRLLATEENGGCWVKMFDFSVNCDIPSVSYNGFTFVNVDWNSVKNMTDNKMDSYTWFDWKNTAGSDITLTYDEVQDVHNIYIMTSHPDRDDHFQTMTLSYSLDGVEYTSVGEECYVEQREVLIELNPTIQAKYIRVVCPEAQDRGFAIREFGINHEKVEAPITFTNGTPYTYTSEAITPTYTIPFLTEAEVQYTSHDKFYSYEAPTKPGWYALDVVVQETAYYKKTHKWAVFCIRDTKEHFISEWTLAMNNGVCDFATNSEKKANYDYLLEVYRDCLTDDVRAEVGNYQWSDSSTILETMQYVEMLNANATSQTALQEGYLINSIHDTNSFVMMIIVLGFGLTLIGGYYLLNKKRTH